MNTFDTPEPITAVVSFTAADIRISAIGRGRADLDVGTGTINVGIPDGTAVPLDAKTTLGRVRDNLGDNPEESGGNTVELHAHVARGDIQLHRVSSGR